MISGWEFVGIKSDVMLHGWSSDIKGPKNAKDEERETAKIAPGYLNDEALWKAMRRKYMELQNLLITLMRGWREMDRQESY